MKQTACLFIIIFVSGTIFCLFTYELYLAIFHTNGYIQTTERYHGHQITIYTVKNERRTVANIYTKEVKIIE